VDLGIVVIYRVPLTLVVFGALLLGMLAMVVVSIDSDLRVRRILRDRLRAEDLEERRRMADPRQRDLFQEEDE
jgi:heme exporter protein D